jgi:hypothetical protein
MQHHYRWRSRPNIAKLKQNIDQLRTVILQLRQQLQTKQTAVSGLELALRERSERIDALNARLEQSREQVRRLGLENELLAAMIAAPELSMTSEQAQAQSQA